jgi:HAMP domain-containing protein
MTIRLKIVIAFLFLVIPSIMVGYMAISQSNKIAKPIKQDIPKLTQELTKAFEFENLSQLILYYDEVLTQSARNFAFTRDIKWKNIYDQSAPLLDKAIKKAINLGDDKDKKYFQEIDSANIALVHMEETSMDLVSKNKQTEAINILEGKEYWTQKEIYKYGLTRFVERRNLQYDQTLSISTKVLENVVNQTQELLNSQQKVIINTVIFSIILAVILGTIIAYLITRPIFLLEKTVQEIAQGNLQKRVDIQSSDEIGKLAQSFNEMANKLEQSRYNVEAQVEQRTKELSQINKYMIQRELKMIGLKKLLRQVQTKQNKPS